MMNKLFTWIRRLFVKDQVVRYLHLENLDRSKYDPSTPTTWNYDRTEATATTSISRCRNYKGTVTSTQTEVSGCYYYPPEEPEKPEVVIVKKPNPTVRTIMKAFYGYRLNPRQMGPWLRTMR